MLKKFANFCKRPLVRDTIKTTFWSTIGRGIGFLIPFFIAAWFGVSGETDAFFFAYGLILFLSNIFAPVVEGVIVPYIAEARTNNEDVGKFIGNILVISGVGLFVLTILALLVVMPVLSVATNFDAKTLRLVCRILVETSPLIILLVWTSVLSGSLNTYKKFTFPAISPAFRALVNLIFIFAFKDSCGVHSIAFGYVAGEIVRLIFLWVAVKQLNLFKLRLSFQLNQKLLEFFKTASYQVAGMAAAGFNPIVNQTMASWLGKGSVSVLCYADRLYMIPVAFMTTGLMVTILSHWSDRYNKEGIQRLKKDVAKAAKTISFITLPIALLLILFHQPIVKLAFGRKLFEQALLIETGKVWVCYLLGFLPYMLCQLYVKGHLVLKNTKTLMQCAFYMNFLNILLNYILIKFFNVAGIALATAIIYGIMFFFLKRRWTMSVNKNVTFDYDSWAADQLKDEKRKSILLWKAEHLAKLVPPNFCFKNALEVGCAEGIVINRLRELLHVQKCYGIDVSHTFLSHGRAAYPEVEFIQVSGIKSPFADKSMDLIVLSDIIEHIEDLNSFMKEVKRVGKMVLLKVPLDKYLWRKLVSEPLGRSSVVGAGHPDGHLREFSKNSCEKMLKNMGCKILASKVVYCCIEENEYRKKHAILKFRWFLDTKLKQLFPGIAHAIWGGVLIVLFDTGDPK